MATILIIGSGGVGEVTVHKALEIPEIFNTVHLASLRLSRCEAVASRCKSPIHTHQLDANIKDNVVALIKQIQPDVVVNCALPVQDLPIMEACYETGVHYVDTSDPDVDEQSFELLGSYRWQWRYQDDFKKAGCTAVLSCGFDPGVVNAYVKFALDHHFDEIHGIDIVDCNGGDHGYAFATNFNPVVNIQEVTADAIHYENDWLTTPAQGHHQPFDFPNIGEREMYLMYHPELESLVKCVPTLKRARFWMTFGESYLKHLDVIRNLGLDKPEPVDVKGQQVAPVDMLQALLPDPASLGARYTGKVCIGTIMEGVKDGQEKVLFMYANADHQIAFKETHTQAVPYTTGIPALAAAQLLVNGQWAKQAGVYHVEELPADAFLEIIAAYGLKTESVWLDENPVKCRTLP